MGPLVGQHILSCDIFEREILEELFTLADVLAPVARGQYVTRVLEGAVLSSLFFEASTRTRLSFDSAFMRLGGSVSSTTGAETTSIAKGESLSDSSRVVSGYCDVVVMRHPQVQSMQEFSAATHIPVINAGNGAGEHPTQALLDLFTIRNEFARLKKPMDGVTIAFIGDLRHGRTVHSLIRLMTLYRAITVICVAPQQMAMPKELLDLVVDRGHRLLMSDRPDEILQTADVVYTTRLQKERFITEPDPYSEEFHINKALVTQLCRREAVIMHPLPRDGRAGAHDLSVDLDDDPRLAIFRQSDAGVPTRMALFATVLGVADQVPQSLRPATWYRPDFVGPQDPPFYRTPAS